MKRFTILLAALATLFALVTPVAAATPLVVEKQAQLTRLFPNEPLCESFTVTSQFQVRRSITQFYDQDGALLREVRHVLFTGSQTNDETGLSIPVNGTFHQVIDLVAGTFTTTGSLRHVTVPGSGIVLHDSGRSVIDLADESVMFIAGPHEEFAGDYDAMCTALAGA